MLNRVYRVYGIVKHFIDKKRADNTEFNRPVGTCTISAQVHVLPSQFAIMCSNLWDLDLDLNHGNINLMVLSSILIMHFCTGLSQPISFIKDKLWLKRKNNIGDIRSRICGHPLQYICIVTLLRDHGDFLTFQTYKPQIIIFHEGN